jgi:hypothetical protein
MNGITVRWQSPHAYISPPVKGLVEEAFQVYRRSEAPHGHLVLLVLAIYGIEVVEQWEEDPKEFITL